MKEMVALLIIGLAILGSNEEICISDGNESTNITNSSSILNGGVSYIDGRILR